MSDLSPISRRHALRITAGVGLGAAFGLSLGREALWRAGLHQVRETKIQMGTVVTLTVVHSEKTAAREMIDQAFGEMERLESVLSRYRRSSAVGRLNATGRLEDAPQPLVEVLNLALDVSHRSRGAFDVTIAPLLELHGSSFDRWGRPPTDREVVEVLSYVGYEGLSMAGSKVVFADPRMAISLDGIAKGFIVDRVVAKLSSDGAERVMVDAGGDIAASRSSERHDAWTVGVQDPRRHEAMVGRVQLDQGGVATSGDYFRHFTPDRRHHDILDPRTGRSPAGLSSASVLAPSAAEADALSTAALVMGQVDGILLIDAYEGAEALLVSKDGHYAKSRAMGRRLI